MAGVAGLLSVEAKHENLHKWGWFLMVGLKRGCVKGLELFSAEIFNTKCLQEHW